MTGEVILLTAPGELGTLISKIVNDPDELAKMKKRLGEMALYSDHIKPFGIVLLGLVGNYSNMLTRFGNQVDAQQRADMVGLCAFAYSRFLGVSKEFPSWGKKSYGEVTAIREKWCK